MSMYQVPFIAAANVPIPPSGEVILFFDLSNSNRLSRKDSSGVVVDLQSGASYTDAEAVAAVAAAIDAAPDKSDLDLTDRILVNDGGVFFQAKKNEFLRRGMEQFFNIFSDFLGSVVGDFLAYQSGAGASSQSGAYGNDLVERAIGVTQSDTGSTATGRAGIGLASPASLRPTVARYRYKGRHAIEAISTPTETFTVRIGLTDSYLGSGDGTNGIYFRYTDLQNGGRWECVSRVAGVEVQAVDSGVAPDLDYHVYQIDLNEAGTVAEFRIDGALVGTINAPLLPGGANAISAGFKIEKSVGTSQRNLSSDYMYFELERSADR